MMNVLIFDITGRFGHFRKYYSNSSALSFGLPPRTTICGMIGAIMGWERDSYYEWMLRDQCKIALACKSPIRKTIHKLNFLYIKNSSHLNASYGLPTQVPFEIVSAPVFRTENLCYRIYINHKNQEIFTQLRNRLMKNESEFSLSLGSANFQASYQWIDEVPVQIIEAPGDAEIKLVSVIPKDKITDFLFEKNMDKVLVNELIPLEFNKQRDLTALKEIIYCEQGQPLHLKVKVPYYTIRIEALNIEENIVFME